MINALTLEGFEIQKLLITSGVFHNKLSAAKGSFSNTSKIAFEIQPSLNKIFKIISFNFFF